MCMELLHDLADEVLGLATVHRHAAKCAHEAAQRPAEQAVLADKTDLPTNGMNRAREHEEIPIGGVGGAHDDELAVGRELAGYGPAIAVEPLQQQPANQPFEHIESEVGVDQLRTEPMIQTADMAITTSSSDMPRT